MQIIDDLEAEQDRLEAILASLDAAGWATPSLAAGWTVCDVVLHLAQTEEAAAATVVAPIADRIRATEPRGVDDAAERMVGAERAAPEAVFDRWRRAAHGLDIAGGLGTAFPDTDRLRHIAWLGHRTLPYAFTLAGLRPEEIYCELSGPDGETWRFGRPEADSSIRGGAGGFCRVGAQRLAPADSGLITNGPHGSAALGLLRNYAA